MALSNFTLKQGDTRPALICELKDSTGVEAPTAIDLTTATEVNFVMRKEGEEDPAEPKVKGKCAITDAAKGIVTYSWKAGNTDTVGTFLGEFEITWNDGGIETVPNDGYFKISIVDDLG